MGSLQERYNEKCKEVEHLKRQVANRDRCIATGRTDGTGTDYPAELAKARKERGDLRRRCEKLEKLMNVEPGSPLASPSPIGSVNGEFKQAQVERDSLSR